MVSELWLPLWPRVNDFCVRLREVQNEDRRVAAWVPNILKYVSEHVIHFSQPLLTQRYLIICAHGLGGGEGAERRSPLQRRWVAVAASLVLVGSGHTAMSSCPLYPEQRPLVQAPAGLWLR
jgi:hypothetical protein